MYDANYYNSKKEEIAKKFQGSKDALIQQMIQLVAGYVNQQKSARDEFKKITDAEEESKNPKPEVKEEKKDEKELPTTK